MHRRSAPNQPLWAGNTLDPRRLRRRSGWLNRDALLVSPCSSWASHSPPESANDPAEARIKAIISPNTLPRLGVLAS